MISFWKTQWFICGNKTKHDAKVIINRTETSCLWNLFDPYAVAVSRLQKNKKCKMADIFIVAILISEIISTISIFMLLNYTIVRYKTNERGGIHTGFASAGIVMIISGICLYCSLKTIETTVLLLSDTLLFR